MCRAWWPCAGQRLAGSSHVFKTTAWLEEAYDLYGRASYSLAVRILGVGADAEDCVVDAFQEVLRLQRRDDHTDVRALTLLITRNASVARLRQRDGLPVHDLPNLHVGSAASLVHGLRAVDDVETRSAWAGLDPTLRLMLERSFFEGQTSGEIAGALGVTEAHVTGARAAALRTLAARWPSPQPTSQLTRQPESSGVPTPATGWMASESSQSSESL